MGFTLLFNPAFLQFLMIIFSIFPAIVIVIGLVPYTDLYSAFICYSVSALETVSAFVHGCMYSFAWLPNLS